MHSCYTCHAEMDDALDACWSCGTSKDGTPDPSFRRADDPAFDAEHWALPATPDSAAHAADFKFNAAENDLIRVLAWRMYFFGSFIEVVGILLIICGMLGLIFTRRGALTFLIEGGILVLIGSWTYAASRSFRRIVDNEGSDKRTLIDALKSLTRLYTLHFCLSACAIGLAAVAFLLVLIPALNRG